MRRTISKNHTETNEKGKNPQNEHVTSPNQSNASSETRNKRQSLLKKRNQEDSKKLFTIGPTDDAKHKANLKEKRKSCSGRADNKRQDACSESEVFIENVIHFIDIESEDSMVFRLEEMQLINPLLQKKEVAITITHLKCVCGLPQISSTNTWDITLLKDRQIRIEDKKRAYRLRLSENPLFMGMDQVKVEGTFVPGGHFFIFNFKMEISDKCKAKWLKLSETNRGCNSYSLDYMIKHPFGALDVVRSILRINFVHDPIAIKDPTKDSEHFQCLYSQNHFFFDSLNSAYCGHMEIGKVGARSEINSLFFIPKDAPEDGTDYMMASAADLAWYRQWKAVILEDYIDDEDSLIEIGEKNCKRLPTPMKVDFLRVRKDDEEKFGIYKFVFDFATRQFSCTNYGGRRECFEVHNIIAKSSYDESDHDFIAMGRNLRTKEPVQLWMGACTAENKSDWEDTVKVPLNRIQAFLDVVFKEMYERNVIVYETPGEEEASPASFEEVNQLMALWPNVRIIENVCSRLGSGELKKTVILSLQMTYYPLLTNQEAMKLVENDRMTLGQVCERETAVKTMQLLHRHVWGYFLKEFHQLKSPKSKLPIWLKLVPHLLRDHEWLKEKSSSTIEYIARYFDKAPYGCPTKVGVY